MKKKPNFSIPFAELEKAVLPKGYELSMVFTDSKLSRKLNRIYRGKNRPTNVLSFPISKNSGEIFIDLDTAKKEAKKFGMTYRDFVKYLFIHGLLHLKGMEHGAKMERAEKILLHGSSNRSRDRHRHLSRKSTRSRKSR